MPMKSRQKSTYVPWIETKPSWLLTFSVNFIETAPMLTGFPDLFRPVPQPVRGASGTDLVELSDGR